MPSAGVKSGNAAAGMMAGTVTANGYVLLNAGGAKMYAHRAAWLCMTGEWPVGDIDHINGVKDDNRWANLRTATRTQNNGNQRVRKDSGSGIKGVYWHKQTEKWGARITYRGKHQSLGLYTAKQEAATAYQKAAAERFGQYRDSLRNAENGVRFERKSRAFGKGMSHTREYSSWTNMRVG